jgi:hypothetical protein
MLSLNNNNGTVYIILVKQLDSNQFFSLKKTGGMGGICGWPRILRENPHKNLCIL